MEMAEKEEKMTKNKLFYFEKREEFLILLYRMHTEEEVVFYEVFILPADFFSSSPRSHPCIFSISQLVDILIFRFFQISPLT